MKSTALFSTMLLSAFLVSNAATANTFSDDEVKTLMKKSHCFRCHAEKRTKDGPAYQTIAETRRGKPGIEAALLRHVTKLDTVAINGRMEDHEPLQTRDDAAARAVVQWILTR
jgi:cytochrome c